MKYIVAVLKYIVGVFVRAIAVIFAFFFLFGVPYLIFWKMPVAVGTYFQKNQHITQKCIDHGALCQWGEGIFFLILGAILIGGLITLITIIALIFKFIFFETFNN